MGRTGKSEELEIFRSVFLDNLKNHRNLTFSQIGQILHAFDLAAKEISLLHDGIKITETRSKKIKHLYLEGMSESAISKIVRMDRRKVHGILLRLGILQPNRWNVDKQERTRFYMDEIGKMRDNGKTYAEISQRLGISQRYIGNLITRKCRDEERAGNGTDA